jgi:hypothetical protein
MATTHNGSGPRRLVLACWWVTWWLRRIYRNRPMRLHPIYRVQLERWSRELAKTKWGE